MKEQGLLESSILEKELSVRISTPSFGTKLVRESNYFVNLRTAYNSVQNDSIHHDFVHSL